jgi:hypothetical protein
MPLERGLSGLGQLHPFSMAVIVTLDRLLQDANQPSGDPFFDNTDVNVSSYRKQSFTASSIGLRSLC